MISTLRYLCLTFSVFTVAAMAQDEGWEVALEEDGLIVQTRSVEGSDFKAFWANTVIDATPEDVFARLQDVKSYPGWFPDTLKAERLEAEDGSLANYVVTDIPWPLKDRDAVYAVSNDVSPELIVTTVTADPDRVPENSKYVRIREASGEWRLTALNEGGTRIDWTFHLEPGGNIPAGLANARVIETPQKALLALKEYFESR
ncbi:MAG: START domain-containing protein [Pseudomonadota bacterium]